MIIKPVEVITPYLFWETDNAFKELFKTLDVLLSRSTIFKYTHDYLTTEERLKEMCDYNKIQWAEGLQESYFYSMAYAHTVFFASGVESFMQHFYKRSVFLYLYILKIDGPVKTQAAR